MLNRLATLLLLLPALALAQVPIRPPEAGDTAGPRPVRPRRPPGAPRRPARTRRAAPPPSRSVLRAAAQQPQTFRPTERCVPLKGRFMLQFNKADIADVLEQASRWTCRNFCSRRTWRAGRSAPLEDAGHRRGGVRRLHRGAQLEQHQRLPDGQVLQARATADAKKNPIPTYTGDQTTPYSEQPITKVIRLSFADADQLRGIWGTSSRPRARTSSRSRPT
jgi:general secretion pathway protein D